MRSLVSWLVVLVWLSAVGCNEHSDGFYTEADLQRDADTQADLPSADVVIPPLPFDWCSADTPDDACYAQKRNPNSDSVALALAIADKQLALHDPAELEWDWEEAVLMWSLTELYRITGRQDLQTFYRGWMDHHIEAGYSISTSDTCAPAAIAAVLYGETGEEKYAQVVNDAFHYLDEEALRTPEGGISHLGTVSIVTLWVDSLFMFGNVMLAWAERSDDPTRLDQFAQQFSIFTEQMQQANGLYVHAVDWVITPPTPVFWARGNGWVAASAYQYLRLRTLAGDGDEVVATASRKLVDGAIELQDDSGLWWDLLDRPNTIYLETSAGALFAYGMARGYRYGFLDDSILPVIAKAMDGVNSRILYDDQDQPVVTGVSGPTSADVAEEYAKIDQVDDLGYGIGAVILALIETSGLPLEQ